MNQEKIGALILTLRKEKGWTQKQLADKLDVTDKAVSKWERGMGLPDVTLLKPLSDALDINVNDLLNGEIEQPNNVDVKAISDVALEIVSYSEKKRHVNTKRMFSYLVSAALLIAMAVCLIVNYATEGTITWALIPLGGITGAWVILMTFLYGGKNNLFYSIIISAIMTLGILFIIQDVTNTTQWASTYGLPITLSAGVFLIATVYLYTRTKLNKWITTAIVFFLVACLNITIDMIIESWRVDLEFYILISCVSLGILFSLFMSKKK